MGRGEPVGGEGWGGDVSSRTARLTVAMGFGGVRRGWGAPRWALGRGGA